MNKITKEEVMGFATSIRGQYIIGQALSVAIEKLEQETDIRFREPSNIDDMKYLRDNLYSLFSTLETVHKTQAF